MASCMCPADIVLPWLKVGRGYAPTEKMNLNLVFRWRAPQMCDGRTRKKSFLNQHIYVSWGIMSGGATTTMVPSCSEVNKINQCQKNLASNFWIPLQVLESVNIKLFILVSACDFLYSAVFLLLLLLLHGWMHQYQCHCIILDPLVSFQLSRIVHQRVSNMPPKFGILLFWIDNDVHVAMVNTIFDSCLVLLSRYTIVTMATQEC